MQEQPTAPPVDPQRAARATLVLRVRRVAAVGGNKFAWDEVDVLKIFKSAAQQQIPNRLRIAHYSWEAGVPEGECTAYLEPYSDAADGLWRLLDGSATAGVTHVGSSPR